MPVKAKRTRRRRYPKRIMMNPVGLNGLPKKFVARHKYVEEIQLNPGIASFTYHDFNLASMYDPNVSGTGHQPRGFDEIMAFYNHYCVIGAKIVVQYRPDTSSSNPGPPSYWGLTKCSYSTEIAQYASVTDLIEGKYTNLNRTSAGLIYPENTQNRCSLTYSPKKWLGISKPLSNDRIRGGKTSDPGEEVIASLWCGGINGVDSPSQNFLVTIYYTVVYTEPEFQAAS